MARRTNEGKSRYRTFRRRAKRLISFGLILFAVSCVFLYYRIEFPNQFQFLGCRVNSSWLARLQGNHRADDQSVSTLAHHPILIGHRGSGLESTLGSNLLIGNTERSIREALEAGVDWIEVDIQISKDKQLVLFHDWRLGEKVDCSKVLKKDRISKFNWDELATLNLCLSPPEPILRLDDVLTKFADAKVKWVFDIKPEDDAKLAEAKRALLIPILQDLGPEQVVLFGPYEVLEYYLSGSESSGVDLSEYSLGLVVDLWNVGSFLFDQETILDRCEKIKARYLVLPALFAETSFVERATKKLDVLVWDCDHPEDQKKLLERGVAGLIVNHPLPTLANLKLPAVRPE